MMPKTIVVDQNAYDILMWAKEQNRVEGIEKPNHSDAIRWLKNAYDELLEHHIDIMKGANKQPIQKQKR